MNWTQAQESMGSFRKSTKSSRSELTQICNDLPRAELERNGDTGHVLKEAGSHQDKGNISSTEALQTDVSHLDQQPPQPLAAHGCPKVARGNRGI
ncbi:hypothetical protein XENTR_v10010875 [Xenopus tropicalis]|nr:hypothetical protein XENTR_v10010875 [Xenopus tropicalis]